jgi:methyl-accepting chemotaxis protein
LIDIKARVNKGPGSGRATAMNKLFLSKVNMFGAVNKIGKKEKGVFDCMNLLPVPAVLVDRDFNIQYVNQAGAVITSTGGMPCTGQKCTDTFKFGCCNTPDCPVSGVFQDGKERDSEIHIETPEGERICRCYAVPVRDDNGILVGALEYFIDIQRELLIKREMDKVSQQYAKGDLDERIDPQKLDGSLKQVANSVNSWFDVFIKLRAREMESFDKIGRGERNIALLDGKGIGGTWQKHREAFNACIGSLNGLMVEVDKLTAAAGEGKLDVRGDASVLQGGWADIVNGFNYVLDSVISPVNEVSEVLYMFARGDMTLKVSGEFKGELVKLKDATNMAIDNNIAAVVRLRDVARMLTESADNLSRASGEAEQATGQIATATQQVSKGAADQAISMQDTMKAIDQLSRAIDQIARGAQEQSKMIEKNVTMVSQVSAAITQVSTNAVQATESARAASATADNGADMVQKTIKGMEVIKNTIDAASEKMSGLGTRSREIGKIVATINDIADQTNLLALNAAIEAARAGEQGRGFAVVADEVRKLAERSSVSTKEIAELISGIQAGVNDTIAAMEKGTDQVTGGYELATRAGGALEEILSRSKEMGEKVIMISAATQELTYTSTEMVKLSDNISAVVEENTVATEEMSATAKQVARSIESVAGIAEQNSASTEEVSASAEEISAQMREVAGSCQTMLKVAGDFTKQISQQKI